MSQQHDEADNLGPKPEPQADTEPEHHPGGVDAVDDSKYGETPEPPTIPDLHPEANPAVDDVVPDEVTEPEEPDSPPASDEEVGTEPPA